MDLPASRYKLGEWLNTRGLIGCGVEVGTYNGWFASDILHEWRGLKLYLVDAWRYLEFWNDPMNAGKEEQKTRLSNTFEKIYNFGRRAALIRELSEDAVSLFSDRSLDFVYIDANHSYDAVEKDILLWEPKIRKGGVLSGHDYLNGPTHNGAVNEVKSAVDDWAKAFSKHIHVIAERPGHEPSWMTIV
jgi:hypothetical protein